MTTLPDRTNITHDDCSTIIEAWQNGRLIDREAINYAAATQAIKDVWLIDDNATSRLTSLVAVIVDAALGLDKETTT